MIPLRASCLSALLACSLVAQTPGVPGTNDYWVTPGGTPGGSSCKAVTLTMPLTMTMNTSCQGGSFVILWSTCLCAQCAPVPAIGIAGCLPGPSSACSSSNQFLEVPVLSPCITFTFSGVTNAAGFGSIQVPVPPVGPPVTLSSQAIFLTPPGCLPPPFFVLLSQAWNVTFV